MRYSTALLLAASGMVLAQTEPANFNVTQALSQYGINVSEIPSLTSQIEERSTAAACVAAVSPPLAIPKVLMR